MRRILKRAMTTAGSRDYRDIAITPPGLDELSLGIYAETRGTAEAIEKSKRQQKLRTDARTKKVEERETVPLAAAE
jgi:hypothetical protein